jgi:hypothetical protein
MFIPYWVPLLVGNVAAHIDCHMQNGAIPLDLTTLTAGHPGLSANVASSFVDAGAVCLEHHGHEHGVVLSGNGDCSRTWRLFWPPATDQTRRTWRDMAEATEYGACGIAILVVKEHTGYSVLERARKYQGCDYWLGEEDDLPFQNKARLEISGILHGNDASVRQRVKEKVEQTRQSDGSGIPAYIVIVEFGRPVSYLVERS